MGQQTVRKAREKGVYFVKHDAGEHSWKVGERYELLRVLGEGSFSAVCLALDTKTGERVAVKRVGDVLASRENAKRVLRECAILRRLDHPNIVALKNLFVQASETGGWFYRNGQMVPRSIDLYIVMEYCNQGDLFDLRGQLSEIEVQYMMMQLLHVLKYIHSCDVWHRDIKSGNILVHLHDGRRLAKLCDFGSARSAHVAPAALHSPTSTGRHTPPLGRTMSFARVPPNNAIPSTLHMDEDPRLSGANYNHSRSTSGVLGTKEDVLVSMTRSVSPMPAANEPKRASIADVYKRFGGGSGRGGVGLPQPMTCTVCTPCYRAPEVIMSQGHYSSALDMWSLGCVFGEMLQRVPYLGKSATPQLQVAPVISVTGDVVTPKTGERFEDGSPGNALTCLELAALFEVVGTPSWGTIDAVVTHPAWHSYLQRLPGRPSQLHRRFAAAGDKAVDLLSRLLEFDPTRRASAEEAWEHQYFDRLKKEMQLWILEEEEERRRFEEQQQQLLQQHLQEQQSIQRAAQAEGAATATAAAEGAAASIATGTALPAPIRTHLRSDTPTNGPTTTLQPPQPATQTVTQTVVSPQQQGQHVVDGGGSSSAAHTHPRHTHGEQQNTISPTLRGLARDINNHCHNVGFDGSNVDMNNYMDVVVTPDAGAAAGPSGAHGAHSGPQHPHNQGALAGGGLEGVQNHQNQGGGMGVGVGVGVCDGDGMMIDGEEEGCNGATCMDTRGGDGGAGGEDNPAKVLAALEEELSAVYTDTSDSGMQRLRELLERECDQFARSMAEREAELQQEAYARMSSGSFQRTPAHSGGGGGNPDNPPSTSDGEVTPRGLYPAFPQPPLGTGPPTLTAALFSDGVGAGGDGTPVAGGPTEGGYIGGNVPRRSSLPWPHWSLRRLGGFGSKGREGLRPDPGNTEDPSQIGKERLPHHRDCTQEAGTEPEMHLREGRHGEWVGESLAGALARSVHHQGGWGTALAPPGMQEGEMDQGLVDAIRQHQKR